MSAVLFFTSTIWRLPSAELAPSSEVAPISAVTTQPPAVDVVASAKEDIALLAAGVVSGREKPADAVSRAAAAVEAAVEEPRPAAEYDSQRAGRRRKVVPAEPYNATGLLRSAYGASRRSPGAGVPVAGAGAEVEGTVQFGRTSTAVAAVAAAALGDHRAIVEAMNVSEGAPLPQISGEAFMRRRRARARVAMPPPAATSAPSSSIAEAAFKVRMAAHQWGQVIIIGTLALLSLWAFDRDKNFEFSLPYLLVYNVLLLRVPDVLGHTVVSALQDAHHYTSPALATTAISLAYMCSMQAYLLLLGWVCTNMTSAHLYPRFHYVAQMYYYLFWYMMLMVMTPGGIEDWSFWVMVAMLNGNILVANIGILQHLYGAICRRSSPAEPPLKTLFDSKLAVQDQLADIVSLLIVPAIATSFHVCSTIGTASFPGDAVISLWQRFGALLFARMLSGLLTEEIFRRRLAVLNKADASELQLLDSPNRLRYMNDVGPNLALEPITNIKRCEVYFTAVAVACTFSVFNSGGVPTRYSFIAFGS